MEYSLGELARILGAELRGDPARRVGGVATLSRAGRGDLSFLHNRRYRGALAGTRASAVVLEAEFAEESPHRLPGDGQSLSRVCTGCGPDRSGRETGGRNSSQRERQ